MNKAGLMETDKLTRMESESWEANGLSKYLLNSQHAAIFQPKTHIQKGPKSFSVNVLITN